MMLDLGDNEMEEIISYNELCDLIQEQSRNPTVVAPPSDRFTFPKIYLTKDPSTQPMFQNIKVVLGMSSSSGMMVPKLGNL